MTPKELIVGIIDLYPIGEKISNSLLEKINLRKGTEKIVKNVFDIVNLTLVSQIITLPILLINFKQLSLISPLANILVLWTFAPLLALLIISLFITPLLSFIGPWIFLPSYLLLRYIFILSKLLAAPSLAAISINSFNWFWGTIYYLILIIITSVFNRRIKD